MKRLVTAAEASRLDSAVSLSCGLPPLLLMEKASLGIWSAVMSILPDIAAPADGPIVALAGPGNNGGDALAVLRHARFSGGRFAGGRALAAVLLSEKQGPLAEIQRASLEAMGVELVHWSLERARAEALLGRASLILDGIAGTGLKGGLRGPAADLAAAANTAGPPILSIDLPSGLSDAWEGGQALVRATWTASVEPRKACLYSPAARLAAGRILAIEGVFPPDLPFESKVSLLEASDLGELCPHAPPSVHKGGRGRLGLFAGSPGMVGAAGLSAAGAAAAGVGITTSFFDAALYSGLSLGQGPSALAQTVIRPMPTHPEGFAALRFDAILAGPGWGRGEDKKAALSSLLGLDCPLVLDADALRLAAGLEGGAGRSNRPLILTPHPGEFEALSGLGADSALSRPMALLPALAADWGAVIVLKSHVTWIAAPDGRLALWDGLEPSLATAGSGDVLAGLAAGFLARLTASSEGDALDRAWRAARAAVIAHGSAGAIARAEGGWYGAGSLAAAAAALLGRRPPWAPPSLGAALLGRPSP